MSITYIGVGANLNDPLLQVQIALDRLSNLPETACISHSSFYRSRPLGSADQPDYINAVVALETALTPEVLLKELQALERLQGRERNGVRWGPRVIDLDILLYGKRVIQSDRLIIPHPGLAVREFVLYPLAEIAEQMVLPTGESVKALKAQCPARAISRIDP